MTKQLTEKMATKLIPAEKTKLAECEKIIERGLKTFYEVGSALLEVRDSRLYRESYKTFEEYCQGQWGMSRFYAYRLIDSASVVTNLLPIGNIPQTESQARPLSKLEPEEQKEAWEAAVETAPDHKPTAQHVQSTVDELFGGKAASPWEKITKWEEMMTGAIGDMKAEFNRVENLPNEEEKIKGFAAIAKVAGEMQNLAAERNIRAQREIGKLLSSENNYELHEVAEVFPFMTNSEFTGLKLSIKELGLIQPITVYQGRIVDGKCRYQACLETGVEPKFQEWDGKGSLMQYVLSMNLHRQQLNESQKACCAVRLEEHLSKSG